MLDNICPEQGENFLRLISEILQYDVLMLVICRARLQGRTADQTQKGTWQDNMNKKKACPESDIVCRRGKDIKTGVSVKVWVPDCD